MLGKRSECENLAERFYTGKSTFLRLPSPNFDDIFPRANKETGWHDKTINDCHQMEMIMQAEKAILETDQHGRLLQQPDLPPNTRMEAIFLILESKSKNNKKRKPSAKIMGKGKITGDIMAPVVPIEDWDVLQ